MTFTKLSEYCLQSDCKQFTVAKIYIRGIARYEAWHGKSMLGTFVNADLAKAECERDAKSEPAGKTA